MQLGRRRSMAMQTAATPLVLLPLLAAAAGTSALPFIVLHGTDPLLSSPLQRHPAHGLPLELQGLGTSAPTMASLASQNFSPNGPAPTATACTILFAR